MKEVEKAYTPRTLAKHWDCTPDHVYKMIRRGELVCFRPGGMIRIRPDEVRRIEASGQPNTIEAPEGFEEPDEAGQPGRRDWRIIGTGKDATLIIDN